MRTNEQRIELMHKRAKDCIQKNEKRNAFISGSLSVMFLGLLTIMIQMTEGNHIFSTNNDFSGNSMLSGNAGGYVLVAVIAFVLAVAVTFVCIRIHEGSKLNNRLNLTVLKSEKTVNEKEEKDKK